MVLGFLTPAVADRNRDDTAALISEDLVEILEDDREINDAALIHTAHQASRGASPLARVEEALHPYSAYLILPLFALANAGVPVSVSGFGDAMSSPVGLGIFLGLVVGAPIGGCCSPTPRSGSDPVGCRRTWTGPPSGESPH